MEEPTVPMITEETRMDPQIDRDEDRNEDQQEQDLLPS